MQTTARIETLRESSRREASVRYDVRMSANDDFDWAGVLVGGPAPSSNGGGAIDVGAHQEWLKATAPLYADSSQRSMAAGVSYRVDPRGIVADLTSGTTSLLMSAQYGLTVSLTPVQAAEAAGERSRGLDAYARDLKSLTDDPSLMGAMGKIAADYFAQGGTTQRNLSAQISQTVGILLAGDSTDVATAANLATGLDIIRKNPFAVAMLAVTLGQERDFASAALEHLAASSALDYNGGKAWNFATARDIASGVVGGMAGLVQVGATAAARAWRNLVQSVPDVSGNPFLSELSLSQGSPVRSSGVLLGPRTKIPTRSDNVTTRSLNRENESADILSSQGGMIVEQNPRIPGLKNPDYRINGDVFDNIAPETSNVRNIWSAARDKVEAGQTKNIVINLADSNASVEKLLEQFHKYEIPDLQRVIIIDTSKSITIFNHR
ncbi:CdiA C-terminal domain-containing protein [Rhizobacter sp. P5_C2]